MKFHLISDSIITQTYKLIEMELPTIDGHFWIVRNGEIVDWDFPEFSKIFKMWDCKNEKHYLPAPNMTQQIMIGMFKKTLIKAFDKPWEETLAEFHALSSQIKMTAPQFSRCFQNCMMELHERGGELVFGSLGFKKKHSEEYHYEWGGVNYKTIADFRT